MYLGLQWGPREVVIKKLGWDSFQSNYMSNSHPGCPSCQGWYICFIEMLCKKPNLPPIHICLVTELWDLLSRNPLCSLHHNIEVTKNAPFQEGFSLKGNKRKGEEKSRIRETKHRKRCAQFLAWDWVLLKIWNTAFWGWGRCSVCKLFVISY